MSEKERAHDWVDEMSRKVDFKDRVNLAIRNDRRLVILEVKTIINGRERVTANEETVLYELVEYRLDYIG